MSIDIFLKFTWDTDEEMKDKGDIAARISTE
jgi:hypothetical protein